MIAVAFALIALGAVGFNVYPPSRDPNVWDLRDLFSTVPTIIGTVLGVIGIIVWLWEVAP